MGNISGLNLYYAGEHLASHFDPSLVSFAYFGSFINYDDDPQGTVGQTLPVGGGGYITFWETAPAHGTTGNDVIYLNGGSDFFQDTFLFADGSSPPIFEGGTDWIYGGTGNDQILAGLGTDHAYGEIGNDLLVGGEGNDYLFGGDGEDTLGGDVGNDFLDGGAGNDILGYARQELLKFLDSLPPMVNLIINAFDDGNDTMQGGDGNDTIYGGRGEDTLYGGNGDDTFFVNLVQDNVSAGADTIMDFEKSLSASIITDRLVVDYSGFEAEVGTVNTTFKNTSELILENGSNHSALDSYIGFLFNEQTHDLSYKTGADFLLLVHFNNEVDHLNLMSNVDNQFTFVFF